MRVCDAKNEAMAGVAPEEPQASLPPGASVILCTLFEEESVFFPPPHLPPGLFATVPSRACVFGPASLGVWMLATRRRPRPLVLELFLFHCSLDFPYIAPHVLFESSSP